MTATRAEVCVTACADAWRGDGEVLAAAMGVCSVLGARLARLTFEPDLLTTDGGPLLSREALPWGAEAGPGGVEGWLPFRDHLWLVLHGRRHVMMGASQLDRHGRSNISAVGDREQPRSQLLGVRGAPGNTLCNPTSYWIPKHSRRVFVEEVDMVSGVGAEDAYDLRRVVTDLAVLDLGGPDRTVRLLSVHPGVAEEEVHERTGFDLAVPEGGVGVTREPSAEELRVLREVLDPDGVREKEVPA
ncbi:CoA-transferase [Nocardiopsis sp. HNM0947]|uniref:CoA-transferase n=1 Tax=Nocardiopsis coralli TaxID=2772213 RepID=A0ABR9PBK0_9ACTN|nr:CoA-transferase [Nocardiopsis coralli]MBE3001214.1 CoA-transferase [Nocardiopsis coralli]